ncbi:FAD/NAD(P)-binding domain-containing protein [Trichoderma citrinoviride]|uniref:FAD/NAD(P)-binding domain-containing protein n=1 Tax=Trichoderma citrinoviride TaxID=58853 RepID=A0A2T4BFL2_9HYPO|nr:FAD/NAD(P)-binding domain-containing protein [Trichoderma citrinoviride]PTB68116.1 FAD/NAD(P)-binding domain-containing protein [Trichoderma citrinoviride]
MDDHGNSPSLDIAIIGAGVVGVHVALGLLHRNIPFTIYEQSSRLKEMGVGIGVPSIIIESMTALHPDTAENLLKVSNVLNNVNVVNGSSDEDLKLRPADRLYDVVIEPFEFRGAHRGRLLDGLLPIIPPGRVRLGKHLESIVDRGDGEKLVLQFSDGSTAEADAVIACDGIKSRVRQILLGKDNPASLPHYTHTSIYRGLVPLDKISNILGNLANCAVQYIGQGASMVTYPIVAKDGVYVNVAAYVHDEEDWPDSDYMTSVGKRQDVEAAFAHFGPSVKELVKTLPEELNRWALFDSHDHPLSSYAFGRVVLAGDAAHASTPHHGAGAGMGIEDALVLATVLKKAADSLVSAQGSASKHKSLEAAFRAYDSARRERSQWLVTSSRHIGVSAQWRDPEIGGDLDLYAKDFTERLHKLMNYDWKDALMRATDEFERQSELKGE